MSEVRWGLGVLTAQINESDKRALNNGWKPKAAHAQCTGELEINLLCKREEQGIFSYLHLITEYRRKYILSP